MQAKDGVVQYQSLRRDGLPAWTPELQALNAARTRLFDHGLVGTYPDGVGYGNLSIRSNGDAFVITGSGTGAQRVLEHQHYCLVERFSLAGNQVWAIGRIDASSESMTHGALYAAHPNICCVIHVHSRRMFDRLLATDTPATPSDVPYGTPAMAYAVKDLARKQSNLPALLVMAGHDEGLVAFGADVVSTLMRVLDAFQTTQQELQP